ncbi:pentapeptide repeat-containing protein [Streptomyces sp. NBC_00885]|uniref:pentapeptide repeat-containing protein n=1 Tax=Streptomyces sp. NBC_00885 TaxID=2975857 RepID=UPI0038657B3C|nr:pentapeptide repeat-containing protein [Streptomyces sp. NBC_00885]
MDFTSWSDWIRAVLGMSVTYAVLTLTWRAVVRAAAFSDAHRRTGRRIVLVPRWLIRPRRQAIRRQLRVSTALRRHQGLSSATPAAAFLDRLVERDRSTRVLHVGRRIWSQIIPAALLLCGAALVVWLLLTPYIDEGPGFALPSLDEVLVDALGTGTYYVGRDEDCASWSLLKGCALDDVYWWSGIESGVAFGVAAALLLAAWHCRRVAIREFTVWESQEPPLLVCLDALTAGRDALRSPAPEASVLDMRIAELRAALRDFARHGLPADSDRRAELEEHSAQVAAALHEAMSRVLRDGNTALPGLVQLLATVQDRLHASRWLALLDPSPPPGPAPVPALQPAATAPAVDTGRLQRYMAIATALPTIPALLALAFTAVAISQAKDTLKLTERDQVATTYNETVANLGDESINVRISSIYALQRIMRESPREQPAIVEVLSAYIREHTKMPKKVQAAALRKDVKTRAADDVQAALTVLGSRQPGAEEERVIDLRRTFLVGADLSQSEFSAADLRGADLTRADLTGGEFENVLFTDASMSEAILSGGDFEDAEFIGTNLTKARWDGADLHDTNLTSANLTGATLAFRESGAVTNLDYADLSGANLTDADLTDAGLIQADFSKDTAKDLPATTLTRTNFTRANLSGALLSGTDRRTAIWKGAVLP